MTTANLLLVALSAALAVAYPFLARWEDDDAPAPSRHSLPAPKNSGAHL